MIVMRKLLLVAASMFHSRYWTTDGRRRTTDKEYSLSVLCRPFSVVCSSVSELFAQDALVETVAGIEQHVHVDAVIHADLDGADRTHLVVVGDGGNGALFGFEHLDGDLGAVRQQRAAPAARPERADRGQRQQ